jgi:hypothetical protein
MTLEAQYKQFLKHNPDTTFSFNEWMKWHGNEIEQALIKMMQDDEELGLYDEPFRHKVETIPAEEILANRSNAYEFIDFDKQETKELNPYIGPFLLKNGFIKQEDNVYTNPECTIVVFDSDYQIDFIDPQHGPVTMYTSWSIPHLVGTLTWHDLIDKNYKK